jgi:hypothetical protein
VVGDCPLNNRFNKIYIICAQQAWEVSRVLRRGEINLTFMRNFNISEVLEWEELERELEGVQLTDEDDSVIWMLTPHGQFTTASLYRFCTFPRVRDLKMEEMWQSKLPMKVKNFVWLVIRNRIQTVDNLSKKRWKENKLCQLCNEDENAEHLLFRCPIVVLCGLWLRMD